MAEAEAKAPAKRHLVWDSATVLLGNVASAALGVAFVSVASKRLGPGQFGTMNAVMVLAGYFSLVTGPLESLVVKAAASAPGQPWSLRNRLALRWTLVVALAWAALMPVASWGWNVPVRALVVGGVHACLGAVICWPRGVLRGRQRFAAYSLNQVVESGGRVVLGLGLLAFAPFSWAAIAGYGLGMLAAVLVGVVQADIHIGLGPARPDSASVGHASFGALFWLFAYFQLTTTADVLAATRWLSATDGGIYSAHSTLSRLLYLGANPLVQVLYSRAIGASREDAARTARSATALTLGLLASSWIVPLFATDLIFRLVFDARYTPDRAVLSLLWFGACMVVLVSQRGLLMVARAQPPPAVLLLLPAAILVGGLLAFHDRPRQIATVAALSPLVAAIGLHTRRLR